MTEFESIMNGLNEAIEYKKGNLEAVVVKRSITPVVELSSEKVKEIRRSLNMSQVMFADVLGVSKKTIAAWEVGTNSPSGIAKRFLALSICMNTIIAVLFTNS